MLAAVLAAALMHAGWNAAIKLRLDRQTAVLLLSIVQGGMAALMLWAVALPAAAALPYLLLSAVLHSAYKLVLAAAYHRADMAVVYPLARGFAPCAVAIAAALLLGEVLGPLEIVAVCAIAAGVMLMSLRGGAAGRGLTPEVTALALTTALLTAAYTLVDGQGARLAGSATAFVLWMFALDAVVMTAASLAMRGRAAFSGLAGAAWPGFVAGALSLGSYWIAVWAMTRAPIALVAALRETSVLFALLISALWLGEPLTRWRVLAGLMILAGVVGMRIG
ncbi:MAG: EamA family transporter [Hyphomicrobiaceae bacterium]